MKRKIRALLVDDEVLARKAVKAMLKDDPEMEVIAECRNGQEAIKAIREHLPDVVFLDIQMPEIDGFQVIEEVGSGQMPVTVFVTAFNKYALRAFEAHALDYLLKPFDHDRFNTALERAKTQVRQRQIGEMSENLFALMHDLKLKNGDTDFEINSGKLEKPTYTEQIDRVVIKSAGLIYFLKTEDIDWIESTGNYLNLHSGIKSHLIRETISDFHAKLDQKKFLRIHRSTIVNIERIKEIQPLFKGEYIITLIVGKRLRSSRGYRRTLQEVFGEAG